MALIPYAHEMGVHGREPLLLLLFAFLITFALTRLYTRLAAVHAHLVRVGDQRQAPTVPRQRAALPL